MRGVMIASFLALGVALGIAVAAVPAAAQTQTRAEACRDLVRDFQQGLLTGEAQADRPVPITDVPSPSAESAGREIARQDGVIQTAPLGTGINPRGEGPGIAPDTMQRPDGAAAPLIGGDIGEEARQRLEDLVQTALDAARRNDADACLKAYRTAQYVARQAGVGLELDAAIGADSTGVTTSPVRPLSPPSAAELTGAGAPLPIDRTAPSTDGPSAPIPMPGNPLGPPAMTPGIAGPNRGVLPGAGGVPLTGNTTSVGPVGPGPAGGSAPLR